MRFSVPHEDDVDGARVDPSAISDALEAIVDPLPGEEHFPRPLAAIGFEFVALVCDAKVIERHARVEVPAVMHRERWIGGVVHSDSTS